MKNIFLILYYGIASKLPNISFPLGKMFNRFRVFTLKKTLVIGNNCRIMKNVYIGSGRDIEIGNYCRINELSRLCNVKIGNYVMIGRETIILGMSHKHDKVDMPMERQEKKMSKQSIIEDDVWLGARVMIMPGVHIKKGCIIASNAVLTKDTEEYGVYGGVPAKLIKKRK